MKWRHRDGDNARAPRISFGPREKSPITDEGVFQAPERDELEEHLRDQGHTPLHETDLEADKDEPALDREDDVTEVTGVGPATADDLESVGVETAGDLADLDPDTHEDVASLIQTAQDELDA